MNIWMNEPLLSRRDPHAIHLRKLLCWFWMCGCRPSPGLMAASITSPLLFPNLWRFPWHFSDDHWTQLLDDRHAGLGKKCFGRSCFNHFLDNPVSYRLQASVSYRIRNLPELSSYLASRSNHSYMARPILLIILTGVAKSAISKLRSQTDERKGGAYPGQRESMKLPFVCH